MIFSKKSEEILVNGGLCVGKKQYSDHHILAQIFCLITVQLK